MAARESRSSPMANDGESEQLIVNTESITAEDLVKESRDELVSKAKSMTLESFRAWLDRRAAELITDKIAEMLLYQRAKLHLPTDANKKVEDFVDGEIRKTVATQYDGVLPRYEKHLAAQGKSLADARAKIRREIIIASFLEEEIKPKIGEPTRAELYAAFESSADSLRRLERRQMSLIEVRVGLRAPSDAPAVTDGSPDDPREAALRRIRAAQADVRRGVDFAEVARKFSDDSRTEDGGAWGWVGKGSVRERYEPAVEALYQLRQGDVSDVIQSGDSFFLVRCDVVEPGVDPDFTSAQPQLREQWTREKYNRLVIDLVNTLRRDARIEPTNLELFHASAVQAALSVTASAP